MTMIPGDGVGPELMASVKDVFSAAGVPVEFEELFCRFVYEHKMPAAASFSLNPLLAGWHDPKKRLIKEVFIT